MYLHSMLAGERRKLLRSSVELALMTALMVGIKEALAVLPNVELVTLLIILGTRLYGWHMLYAVYAFVLLETFLYGAGMWTVMYCYVWPLLVCAVMLFRCSESRVLWAALAGVYGLLFGAFCALVYVFVGGWSMAFAYWVSGIPYDLLHAASNTVLVFLLLPPLLQVAQHMRSRC